MSTLDPAGPAARGIDRLWWAMLIGAALITALVGGLLWYAWAKRREECQISPRLWIIGGGLIFPLATLGLLLLFGLGLGEKLLPQPAVPALVTVQARGHQWWWEFIYSDAGRPLYTASELHIPAGRPIDIRITGEDVIHSFWVPRLAGKLDAIPGHVNTLRIEAPAPGRYHGHCAEFCGNGHTRFFFSAVAQEPAAFEAWLDRLAASALSPDPAFTRACGGCHAVDPRIRSPAPNLAGVSDRRWALGHPLAALDRGGWRRWLHAHGGTAANDTDLDGILAYLGIVP